MYLKSQYTVIILYFILKGKANFRQMLFSFPKALFLKAVGYPFISSEYGLWADCTCFCLEFELLLLIHTLASNPHAMLRFIVVSMAEDSNRET